MIEYNISEQFKKNETKEIWLQYLAASREVFNIFTKNFKGYKTHRFHINKIKYTTFNKLKSNISN